MLTDQEFEVRLQKDLAELRAMTVDQRIEKIFTLLRQLDHTTTKELREHVHETGIFSSTTGPAKFNSAPETDGVAVAALSTLVK